MSEVLVFPSEDVPFPLPFAQLLLLLLVAFSVLIPLPLGRKWCVHRTEYAQPISYPKMVISLRHHPQSDKPHRLLFMGTWGPFSKQSHFKTGGGTVLELYETKRRSAEAPPTVDG